MKTRYLLFALTLVAVFTLAGPAIVPALATDSAPAAEEDPLADFESDDAFQSDETVGSDDALGDDFEDDAPGVAPDDRERAAVDESEAAEESPTAWDRLSIDGYAEVGAAVNVAHKAPPPGQTDWRGLSKLKTELQLEAEYDIADRWEAFVSGNAFYDFAYTIQGRDNYTSEVLRTYEQEIELRKAYIQGRLTPKLDIKAGRQIVVWGRSDNIRITDVLNPLDRREPGLVDIEEIRLPLAMTKLDYYLGAWGLSGIAVHEHRYNKNPVYGSDFYPFSFPLPPENIPSASIDNTELALALTGVYSGWDLSLYLADYYDDDPHLEVVQFRPEQFHARLLMVGTAFNITSGNWLFKGECAYINGIKYNAFFNGFQYVDNPGTYTRLDYLAGVEYMGIDETTIALEMSDRLVTDFDDLAELSGARKHLFQTALRITSDFLNETLHFTFFGMVYGPQADDGAFFRLTGVYDVTDNVELTVGGVVYTDGDLDEFSNIGDNDRVFCGVKYHF